MFSSQEVDTSQRPRFSEQLQKQMLLTVDTCLQVSDLLYLYSHWLLDSFVYGRHSANEVRFPLCLEYGSLQLLTCHGLLHVSSSTQPRLSPSWVQRELQDYGSGRIGMDLFELGNELEYELLLTVLLGQEKQFGEHLRSLPFFLY